MRDLKADADLSCVFCKDPFPGYNDKAGCIGLVILDSFF